MVVVLEVRLHGDRRDDVIDLAGDEEERCAVGLAPMTRNVECRRTFAVPPSNSTPPTPDTW